MLHQGMHLRGKTRPEIKNLEISDGYQPPHGIVEMARIRTRTSNVDTHVHDLFYNHNQNI